MKKKSSAVDDYPFSRKVQARRSILTLIAGGEYTTRTMADIHSALNNIIRYGTPLQRKIAGDLKTSGISLGFGSPTSDAATTVPDPGNTQQKINTTIINEHQALSEIKITINFNQKGSGAALERCLVHEGRHAYHVARVISEFSQAHRKKNPYNPNLFTVEYAAYETYAVYAIQTVKLNHPEKQLFINHSIDWGVTKWSGKNLIVDTAGIYKFILNGYGFDGKSNVGTTIGDFFDIAPRTV